jgi:serine phosphatase RsbU (regulator of sigma subunit)
VTGRINFLLSVIDLAGCCDGLPGCGLNVAASAKSGERVPDIGLPGSPGAGVWHALSAAGRLLEAASGDDSLPELVVSQAVSVSGAQGGVLYGVFGDRVVELGRHLDPRDRHPVSDRLRVTDRSLPAVFALADGRPAWFSSSAELASRFPRLAGLPTLGEIACAVIPLQTGGPPVGLLELRFAGRHSFTEADQGFLLELAGICARHLRSWSAAAPAAMSATQFAGLVRALSLADSAEDVAQAVAETGTVAGAQFASIAILNQVPGSPARVYHAPGLAADIADRYPVIAADESTPLGAVLASGGEVWLSSLEEITVRYPALLGDMRQAGLAATASVALTDRQQRVIGAIGMGWACPQAFTDGHKDEVRIVARLAADALGRAQRLEAERAARQRTEQLQAMMTALVSSASLAEVTESVFQHGLLPFGASAARLAIVDRDLPDRVVTVSAVGLPEPELSGWRDRPLASYTPSRKAFLTSATVYVPTQKDLENQFPDVALPASGPREAWAAVPLRSGGRTLGVLTLVFSRPHPLDETQDQIALTALGSAVADAVGRAAQHDSDRDVVMSVQRSLLSGVLPDQPGIRLGARYMPAEARYGVGGDWYDAVVLPGGRMMLVVGDVAGHGLQTAITMGQIRSAARALALANEPASLLDALDHFICESIEEPLVTAAAVVVDPARHTLRYSLAGHLPPMIREPGGSVRTLDQASGMLLGLGTRGRHNHEASYAPGSHLTLFTDGLIERRDESLSSGLERLAHELQASHQPDPVQLCDVLVRKITPRNGREDDTAILCALLSLEVPTVKGCNNPSADGPAVQYGNPGCTWSSTTAASAANCCAGSCPPGCARIRCSAVCSGRVSATAVRQGIC